jgi:hypothetical protein
MHLIISGRNTFDISEVKDVAVLNYSKKQAALPPTKVKGR